MTINNHRVKMDSLHFPQGLCPRPALVSKRQRTLGKGLGEAVQVPKPCPGLTEKGGFTSRHSPHRTRSKRSREWVEVQGRSHREEGLRAPNADRVVRETEVVRTEGWASKSRQLGECIHNNPPSSLSRDLLSSLGVAGRERSAPPVASQS